MSHGSMKYLLLAAPFLLSACGDGYEAIRTTEYMPYGNQRTAGSGVAYVLSSMLPEKELKLEPATRPMEAEPQTETEAETKAVLKDLEKDMDEIFEEKQKK